MSETTHQQRLLHAMAEEFHEVRRLLEGLADALVMDENMIRNHVDKLQQFDLIVQHLDEGAKLLIRIGNGSCLHEAVGHVCLGLLQNRLHNAIAKV